MKIFHRKIEYCSVCGNQLKFKYKPEKSWEIPGKLCGDCHTSKMKEFLETQRKLKELEEIKQNHCSICGVHIESNKKKPRWQWNLSADTVLCSECYCKKEEEYRIRVDYCFSCKSKLGLIRYNPKVSWKVNGQLCRRCWDRLNNRL